MKKQSLLLLLTLFCSGVTQAQSTLKTGLSYTRFGIDGQHGVGYYTEYNRQLSTMLSLAPSIQMAYGAKGREFPYYLINKFTAGVDINLFYHPVRLSRGTIRFGIGPSLRYFSGRNLSSFTVMENSGIVNLGPTGDYWVPYFFPNDRIKPNYITIGYNGIVEGELSLSNHWMGGLRVSYQGYSSNDKITSISVNAGYRF